MKNVLKSLIRPTLIFTLASTVGCVGMQTADPNGEAKSLAPQATSDLAPAEKRYDTAEEAAVAAVQQARAIPTRRQAERLHVGSIVEQDGQFSFVTSTASKATPFTHRRRPTVRFSLGKNHVATYIVHPRTGNYRLDRANENFTASEMNVVDEADPLHRPLFLLTPSGRIVGYYHEAEPTEIATLRRGVVTKSPAFAAKSVTRLAQGDDR